MDAILEKARLCWFLIFYLIAATYFQVAEMFKLKNTIKRWS